MHAHNMHLSRIKRIHIPAVKRKSVREQFNTQDLQGSTNSNQLHQPIVPVNLAFLIRAGQEKAISSDISHGS